MPYTNRRVSEGLADARFSRTLTRRASEASLTRRVSVARKAPMHSARRRACCDRRPLGLAVTMSALLTGIMHAQTASRSDAPALRSPTTSFASNSDVRSLPIDLPTVLRLADASNPTIALARERVREAYAHLREAEVLWLPNLQTGPAY